VALFFVDGETMPLNKNMIATKQVEEEEKEEEKVEELTCLNSICRQSPPISPQ
jgi:hypothetical protein